MNAVNGFIVTHPFCIEDIEEYNERDGKKVEKYCEEHQSCKTNAIKIQ